MLEFTYLGAYPRLDPCSDASMDNLGAVYFWHSHALISDATKAGLLAQCNFSTVGPLKVQIDSTGKVGLHFAF